MLLWFWPSLRLIIITLYCGNTTKKKSNGARNTNSHMITEVLNKPSTWLNLFGEYEGEL